MGNGGVGGGWGGEGNGICGSCSMGQKWSTYLAIFPSHHRENELMVVCLDVVIFRSGSV